MRGKKVPLTMVLVLFLGFVSPIFAQPDVNVTIPDTSADSGTSISIPIRVDDVTGKGIYSFGIRLSYSSSVLVATGATTDRTIASGWGAPTVNPGTGQVVIGIAGTSALSNSGVLVYVNFDVIGSPGDTTTIHFAEMTFNEGSPGAITHDGLFTVTGGQENPLLVVTPTTLDFGTSATTKSFNISNGGGGTLIWNISEDVGWITNVNPSSGTGAATVQVTISRSGLSPGSYTDTIEVTSNGGNQNVTVNMMVPGGGAEVIVTIPDTSSGPNTSISIPIRVDDVTGKGIYSVGIRLTYSSNVLVARGATTDGTIASAWGAPTVNPGTGQVTIGMAGANPLSGSGVLVYVNFDVVGSEGDTTTIHFAEMIFNEGSPRAITHDGLFTVISPGTGPPIASVVDSAIQYAGAEFWVDIKVGDDLNPVSNLFGISFDLRYTHTNYIDVVDVDSVPDGLLGPDVIFYSYPDDPGGKVSTTVTRKAGAGGVDGSGVVARIKLKSLPNTPDGTQVNLSISNVTAIDPNGSRIPLIPKDTTVTIRQSLEVWPGDTDNNGVVNIADILPIGLYWGMIGPPRTCHPPDSEMVWIPHYCQPWTPLDATYADANGDGEINHIDILPIGLNWRKRHTALMGISAVLNKKMTSTLGPTIKPEIDASRSEDREFWVDIQITDVTNLFGIAFELLYTNKEFIDSVYTETGHFMGSDVLFYSIIEKEEGRVSIGITRKAGQGGVSGDGVVAKVFLKALSSTPDGTEIVLTIQNISAVDPQGNPISFITEPETLITEVQANAYSAIPEIFFISQNYPNPFNSQTIIQYQLPKRSRVTIKIFNLLGQEIETLVDEEKEPGYYTATWDGRDSTGREVASGIYLYQIKAGNFTKTRKMLLLR